MYYKEAILCLMFGMAEADGRMRDDELISIVTMKEIFKGYSEHDIVVLYKEYKERFSDKNFTEVANVMGVSDVAVKTLLLASLSKKLLMDVGRE